jgi:replicative DNA helicase
MRTFDLSDDFILEQLERELLAAVIARPELYWEVEDLLTADAFGVHGQEWQRIGQAVRSGESVEGESWGEPAANGLATAHRIADLYRHRMVAEAQQKIAAALYDPSEDGEALIARFEDEANNLKTRVRKIAKVQMDRGSDLLAGVLEMARLRRQERNETGKNYLGLETGLKKLDQMLNGLGQGLHVLAAGPGVGKTTLALQWGLECARAGVAVVYVSYENSPQNLALKLLAGAAGVAASDIERGYGDSAALEATAEKLRPVLERMVILEGNGNLSVSQIQGRVKQAQNESGRGDVFVVVDYLQRAAHQKGYDQLRHSVSSLAGELREMANRTGGAVLAISSQNRAGGDYGKGVGAANLDSLKESGDLEYSADTAMFLTADGEGKATPPARAMKLVVLKNRFGATGVVPLIFRPDLGIYREAGA